MTAKYRGIATVNQIKNEENIIVTKFDGGYKSNDYDELINKTEPYFRWLAKVRSKKEPDRLMLTSRDMAVRFWYQQSMGSTKEALKREDLGSLQL